MSFESSYVYRIDGTDYLTYVSNAWVAFAQENGARELVPSNVIGHIIWSFIEGSAIRDFYQAMFDRVRVSKAELVVPFRCDSPDTIRQMELAIRPMDRGGLELEGRVLSIGSRDNVHLFDRYAGRAIQTIPICSFCRRVAVSGCWLEASEAVSQYGFFSGPTQPRLSEQICTSCAGRGI